MTDYQNLPVSNETKERFEEARKSVNYEEAKTADAFVNYLLDLQDKKKK
jgi:hypothetical protein